MIESHDSNVRLAAFNWLEEQVRVHGDVLPRKMLEQGFVYRDNRINLLGAKGIWKPKIMKIPLSITTVVNGPYRDNLSANGFLEYRYRGTDPAHSDNVGLREAMKTNTPLVYFYALVKGHYLPIWPVYIINDNPSELSFSVAVDDISYVDIIKEDYGSRVSDSVAEIARRQYITTTVRQRVHQRSFRERVLNAYNDQCALCRLKHRELLDAAHIIPDCEPEGLPLVSNGLSLCKLHHAAFDNNIFGITPDYEVRLREDVLHEKDGPMLKHGLQEMHGTKILIPGASDMKPDREFLERRYEEFRRVG